jgi:hypothetical protein
MNGFDLYKEIIKLDSSIKVTFITAFEVKIEPMNDGTCPEGYDITKDGGDCVSAQEVDCNEDPDNSLCNGEDGRNGSIFRDEYAQLTGSRIA